VNKTIAVFGAMEPIFRAASRPFITGIDRSRMTTSGLRDLTRSTAIAPFSASPQTRQSPRCSNQDRSDRRISALSSTINTVVDILASRSPLSRPGRTETAHTKRPLAKSLSGPRNAVNTAETVRSRSGLRTLSYSTLPDPLAHLFYNSGCSLHYLARFLNVFGTLSLENRVRR